MVKPRTEWDLVKRLFEEALDLPVEARGEFLESSTDSLEVRREVQRLLASARAVSESFLEPSRAAELGPPPTATEPGEGDRIGPYTIVDRIGAGGMGVVFEARQEAPRRRVALKTIGTGWATPERADGIRREAEVLGSLVHPHVAQVYEAGVDGPTGRPFIAMELVEDAVPVTTYAARHDLSLRERLRLFLAVCSAVQHAHQRGVVHSDLKPSNVLVDPTGRARVIDFGIARLTGRHPLDDAHGAGPVRGTLQYMSPEQFERGARGVDIRVDVFALGAILHELLSGRSARPPFDGDLESYVLGARTRPVPRLRVSPRDLAYVTERALALDPDERYASVSELTADVERVLDRRATRAGPRRWSSRARAFVRRHAIVLVALVATLGALSYDLVRTRTAARQARAEADEAYEVIAFLDQAWTAIDPMKSGDDLKVVDVLEESARRVDSSEDFADDTRAALHNVIGRSYLALRSFEQAERHLASAEGLAASSSTLDARLRLEIGATRAAWLLAQARRQEALDLSRGLEARALDELGPNHDVTLRIQGTLAEGLMSQAEELDEASRRFDALIDRLVARFGPDHDRVVGPLGGRALTWMKQGETERARVELDRILAQCSRLYGPTHFRTRNAQFNLGNACVASGEYELGEQCYREVLAATVEGVRSDHPFLFFCHGNLAMCLARQQRFGAAVEAADDAHAVAIAAWGAESHYARDIAEKRAAWMAREATTDSD